jgi:hypothetical protein
MRSERRQCLKILQRATEPTQELDFAVPPFEPDQFLLLALEPALHSLAGGLNA